MSQRAEAKSSGQERKRAIVSGSEKAVARRQIDKRIKKSARIGELREERLFDSFPPHEAIIL
jgi:uncharacterized protein YgbK (DUF1537 family)